MPHATMDPRRHPGSGTGASSPNMYYTLQPIRGQHTYQDTYGSLPSHGDSLSYRNAGPVTINPQGNYGTLPSQHSRLPSYNGATQSGALNARPVQMSGYNTLPAQGANYGTLPSQQDYSSQTLPGNYQHEQVPQRQLPAPSLSRHTMKILQVPILVVGEEMTKGSPSPSPSPSSTISDPATAPSPLPRTQPGLMHLPSTSPRTGGHVQVPSPVGTPPKIVQGSGTFPHSQNIQYQKFPPATGQSQGFSHSQNTSGGSPQSAMTSQGAYPQGMVHAATLPHRSSSAIPTHLQQQRPSPSSSPGSTSSLPATLPNHHHHHHHLQQQHVLPQHHEPLARPSPTPSPIPNSRPQQPQASPSQLPLTTSLIIHNQPSPPVTIPPGNNFNTFPGTGSMGPLSHMVENPKSALGTPPVMDISGKMRSMQEDMQRMQKQMEDQFRNLHVGPPALANPTSGFPDMPAMLPPSFGGIQPPAYADLSTHASSSSLAPSTPSLGEPDFGTMMSSDMGIGHPIVEDTFNGKGGKKQLKLNLDMHEFAPGEVKVRSDKNKLEVTAHHEEKDPNRITCRVFKQQYHLPENTRMAKLQYDMTPDGELKVEGTVKPRHRVKWAADTLTK